MNKLVTTHSLLQKPITFWHVLYMQCSECADECAVSFHKSTESYIRLNVSMQGLKRGRPSVFNC